MELNDALMTDFEMMELLKKFNGKDSSAFGEVYLLYVRELHNFARKLYQETTVDASDVVHDAFMKIWISKSITFNEHATLKAYLYVSIKNQFKDYLKHNKCVTKFNQAMLEDDNYMVSQMIEGETLSIVNHALDILPKECARVFKLHIDGWNVKDIAAILGKSERTVFIQKQKSISILKEKLPVDKLLLIAMFLK